ncbi:uncharacterized protein CXQ87_002505 [Candidozyma duobushaemuli]|uniref:Uncharacterized protein n=1 Tax=Candidozyma duobushaemuli TaxID=1231522 RepID=A0A2V1A999_9ASCO|nr:uncharacterized protein CXQ87_002505 [[Candida] duobushaemulonis]PVH14372.1 hypothetical protein CXQ87_002505 [[Candida] duobushaemulonis]
MSYPVYYQQDYASRPFQQMGPSVVDNSQFQQSPGYYNQQVPQQVPQQMPQRMSQLVDYYQIQNNQNNQQQQQQNRQSSRPMALPQIHTSNTPQPSQQLDTPSSNDPKLSPQHFCCKCPRCLK